MLDCLTQLAPADLNALAQALRTGRLVSPYSAGILRQIIGAGVADQGLIELRGLTDAGFTEAQIAIVCELILRARQPALRFEDLVELVTSGPETPAVTNRDTAVVVRDLFRNAHSSVILAGYAVYRGHVVFQALAERMHEFPNLNVRLLLDIRRQPGDPTPANIVVRRFIETFQSQDWPNAAPLPEIYYDPRSLELARERRASMHAKCVVVDEATAFISSANFTEAAQDKNIEVGLLVRIPALAAKLANHFNGLIGSGVLLRAC